MGLGRFFSLRRRSYDAYQDGNGAKKGEIWLTVFSDMSTNLLLFFLLLYAVEIMDVESRMDVYDSFESRFGSAAAIRERRAEDIRQLEALEKALARDELRGFTKVETYARVTRVTLREPVLFRSGQAELLPQSREILRYIAESFIDTEHSIVVDGHTDSIPISTERFPSNWELAAARSFSIIEFFSQLGISSERMSANAYGEHAPVASNESEEGRAANRRIEINIVRES